jgi:hypothetical protein
MFWASNEGCCPFVKPPRERKSPPKKKVVLQKEVPASGVVNSSRAFSAMRSTMTAGGSMLTSVGGGTAGQGVVSRQVKGMENRLMSVPTGEKAKKKRRLETVREQVKNGKIKREGYCENCKAEYEDYDAVRPSDVWLTIAYVVEETRQVREM